jgi:hypothetical protein
MLMASDAQRGHLDPWVAERAIRANHLIRSLDQPGADAALRAILDEMLCYAGDGFIRR